MLTIMENFHLKHASPLQPEEAVSVTFDLKSNLGSFALAHDKSWDVLGEVVHVREKGMRCADFHTPRISDGGYRFLPTFACPLNGMHGQKIVITVGKVHIKQVVLAHIAATMYP